jgi:predicted DNA-binding protein (MmcQ/YjbR family)
VSLTIEVAQGAIRKTMGVDVKKQANSKKPKPERLAPAKKAPQGSRGGAQGRSNEGSRRRLGARSRAHPAATALRKAALAYPQTVEDHPWGETAFKVLGKKVFCFFSENGEGGFACSLKLPFRAEEALKHKFARPTAYGLGRAGWVSLTFSKSDAVEIALLLDWLDESWRAVAPKKLSLGVGPPKAKGAR